MWEQCKFATCYIYIGYTATPAIDRISLSPTGDVPCTSSDPQNSFTFCEHPNKTRWTEEYIIYPQEQSSLIWYISFISVCFVRITQLGPQTAYFAYMNSILYYTLFLLLSWSLILNSFLSSINKFLLATVYLFQFIRSTR